MVISGPAGALQLWQDSCFAEVEVRAPFWPELSSFFECTRKTYGASEGAEILQGLAGRAFEAYRVLASSPLAPSHPIIGLDKLIADSKEFARQWPSHSATHPVRSLAEAATVLLPTQSVFVAPLEAVISRFDSGVLVAPRANLVELIRRTINDELELNGLAVHTKTELNSLASPRYDIVIVIGEPGATYASFRSSAKMEARRNGWLLTAPPARRVALLIAGDCQSVDGDSYWLLGASYHPPLILHDDHDAPIQLPSVSHYLVERPTWPTVTPSESYVGEPTTLARQVSFTSGRVAFFRDQRWPQPKVLSVGESGLAILPGTLLDLSPGALVVLRVGRSDQDEIRHRAEARLRREGWTGGELDEAATAVSFLKERLQKCLDREGADALRQRLVKLGLPDSYALTLTRNPLDDNYIAPLEKGYDAFVDAIGALELNATKPLLFKLRAAHRQVGNEIRTEMQKGLEADHTWMDALDNSGFAKVDTMRLGSLFVEVVSKVHEQCLLVPTTHLGQMLDASGHRFTPTTEEREHT